MRIAASTRSGSVGLGRTVPAELVQVAEIGRVQGDDLLRLILVLGKIALWV